jgi:thioredoxin-like negative regulator of GroEL
MGTSGVGSDEQQLALVGSGLVLVDFWAAWGDVCQAATVLAEELVDRYPGRLRTTRINVDDHPILAARYNVHAVPTLALVKDGQLVDQFVGFASRERLQEAIDWALAQAR